MSQVPTGPPEGRAERLPAVNPEVVAQVREVGSQ